MQCFYFAIDKQIVKMGRAHRKAHAYFCWSRKTGMVVGLQFVMVSGACVVAVLVPYFFDPEPMPKPTSLSEIYLEMHVSSQKTLQTDTVPLENVVVHFLGRSTFKSKMPKSPLRTIYPQ